MADTKTHHIMSFKTYLTIASLLFILTGITVGVSFIDLDGWNAIVAVFIASGKAMLVALFFMHLYYDDKLNLLIFGIGLLFITIFISLTMFDTLRRADIYEIRDIQIQPSSSSGNTVSDTTDQKNH